MDSGHSRNLQIWSSLGLGALLFAYLTAGRSLPRFVVVFIVSFLFLTFLFFGFVRVLKVWRESGRLHEEVERQLLAARALSQTEAEVRALNLLSDPGLYRIVENPIGGDSLALLGPGLQKFFSRFETVREIKGETSLDRNQIGRSTLSEGFLRIGTDMEHTEIVVRPNDDTIYVIDGTEPEEVPVEEGFPTIYHYIVAGYHRPSESEKKADA